MRDGRPFFSSQLHHYQSVLPYIQPQTPPWKMHLGRINHVLKINKDNFGQNKNSKQQFLVKSNNTMYQESCWTKLKLYF